MKLGVHRSIVILLFALLVVFNAYQWLEHRRLVRVHEQSGMTVASVLGRLVAIDLAIKEKGVSLNPAYYVGYRDAMTQLGLMMLSQDLNISDMNADAFEGLCVLIANADRLYSVGSGDAVEAQVNRLINAKLRQLQPRVESESSARSLRLGDAHRCALRATEGKT